MTALYSVNLESWAKPIYLYFGETLISKIQVLGLSKDTAALVLGITITLVLIIINYFEN